MAAMEVIRRLRAGAERLFGHGMRSLTLGGTEEAPEVTYWPRTGAPDPRPLDQADAVSLLQAVDGALQSVSRRRGQRGILVAAPDESFALQAEHVFPPRASVALRDVGAPSGWSTCVPGLQGSVTFGPVSSFSYTSFRCPPAPLAGVPSAKCVGFRMYVQASYAGWKGPSPAAGGTPLVSPGPAVLIWSEFEQAPLLAPWSKTPVPAAHPKPKAPVKREQPDDGPDGQEGASAKRPRAAGATPPGHAPAPAWRVALAPCETPLPALPLSAKKVLRRPPGKGYTTPQVTKVDPKGSGEAGRLTTLAETARMLAAFPMGQRQAAHGEESGCEEDDPAPAAAAPPKSLAQIVGSAFSSVCYDNRVNGPGETENVGVNIFFYRNRSGKDLRGLLRRASLLRAQVLAAALVPSDDQASNGPQAAALCERPDDALLQAGCLYLGPVHFRRPWTAEQHTAVVTDMRRRLGPDTLSVAADYLAHCLAACVFEAVAAARQLIVKAREERADASAVQASCFGASLDGLDSVVRGPSGRVLAALVPGLVERLDGIYEAAGTHFHRLLRQTLELRPRLVITPGPASGRKSKSRKETKQASDSPPFAPARGVTLTNEEMAQQARQWNMQTETAQSGSERESKSESESESDCGSDSAWDEEGDEGRTQDAEHGDEDQSNDSRPPTPQPTSNGAADSQEHTSFLRGRGVSPPPTSQPTNDGSADSQGHTSILRGEDGFLATDLYDTSEPIFRGNVLAALVFPQPTALSDLQSDDDDAQFPQWDMRTLKPGRQVMLAQPRLALSQPALSTGQRVVLPGGTRFAVPKDLEGQAPMRVIYARAPHEDAIRDAMGDAARLVSLQDEPDDI